ncbi:MAG TPA: PhnD/SsuA/transferrin family substrate-binding protein [Aestuariivirga sp.]
MFATASLPMYDWPEIRAATDAFWAGLARHAGLVGELTRNDAYDALWRDPALLFSQTCGYPFTHEFRGKLSYIATPHYAAQGCEGANYSSFIFARESLPASHFGNAKSAVNSLDSMSGMLALKLAFANQETPLSKPLITGSHVASLAAVQSGQADVCAIEAVVVALARRHRPHLLQGLHEIARSPLVPGLPFVTRSGDVTQLREALQKAFADPSLANAREAMMMTGFSILPTGAYDVILQREAEL